MKHSWLIAILIASWATVAVQAQDSGMRALGARPVALPAEGLTRFGESAGQYASLLDSLRKQMASEVYSGI